MKFGELRGIDRNGNKYFENTEYPFGQHRWVEYKVRGVRGSGVAVGVRVMDRKGGAWGFG